MPSLSKIENPQSPSSFCSGSLNVYVSVSSWWPSYASTLSITLSRVTLSSLDASLLDVPSSDVDSLEFDDWLCVNAIWFARFL